MGVLISISVTPSVAGVRGGNFVGESFRNQGRTHAREERQFRPLSARPEDRKIDTAREGLRRRAILFHFAAGKTASSFATMFAHGIQMPRYFCQPASSNLCDHMRCVNP